MADILSDVLDTVSLKSTIYFSTEFHPDFSIAVPSYLHACRFHVVIEGACHVSLTDGRGIRLAEGDVAFIPNGAAHILSSDGRIDGEHLEDALRSAKFTGRGPFVVGSGGSPCRLVCGHFTFADGADHPLLRAIPELLYISAADRADMPMLDDVLKLMMRRMMEDDVGAAASVSRLSEVLYIEAMRASISKAPELARLMSAILDPQIGRALSLVHGDIAAPWTVESLASAAGMSRSRFAERFRELIGCGPIAYIGEWRLQRALAMLARPRTPIKSIAHAVGYQSAAAFTRVFTERFGHSPREHRQNGD